MSNTEPWLSILGWGENGIDGLAESSLQLLHKADYIFAAERHLALLPSVQAQCCAWPVPFSEGIELLLAQRGKNVVMLASGNPFWFGAGTSISKHLQPHEWQAIAATSTFDLAAAVLGWKLEGTHCLGLHAAMHTRLRPYLQRGNRILVLLRDGAAVLECADLIRRLGFGDSQLIVMEALGGKHERVRYFAASDDLPDDIKHPVVIGLQVAGEGESIPLTPGIPDHFFETDGQITKQNIRALSLAALAPRQGECLWDIGAGSGSIAIEWLLSHSDNQALAFEQSSQRAAIIRRNANALGVDWLHIIEGDALDSLAKKIATRQTMPNAVFIGGGLSQALLELLWQALPQGTRIVANAVTLESETLLTQWHADKKGSLNRFEVSASKALGSMRAWEASYPIVQWRVVR